jgi:hypothetical protein
MSIARLLRARTWSSRHFGRLRTAPGDDVPQHGLEIDDQHDFVGYIGSAGRAQQ